MTSVALGLIAGAVLGAIGALLLVVRQAAAGRLGVGRGLWPKPHKTVIHMRGHEPAWFAKKYCQVPNCVSTMTADGQAWHRRNACYVDQLGQYWCELHLPKDTKIAERAALQETEDRRCVIHDCKCPNPWEPY